VVSECGPDSFVIFLSVACVIGFALYLSVKFLK
jgi:hypothetical protein